jgi:hypothetical protein
MNQLQATITAIHEVSAWWWFVVGVWSFVWKMWIPDSAVSGFDGDRISGWSSEQATTNGTADSLRE